MAEKSAGAALSVASEDEVETDKTCSPQFVQEVIRMKNLIRNLVEDNDTRAFFRPLTSNIGDETALLRIQFNKLLSKMEEKEKISLVKELIKMVHHVAEKNSPDRIFLGTNYERVVDQLLRYAYEKGVISINICVEGLIMTSDFRLCSGICQKKWQFIYDCIPKIDYKGIRNVLRYILESQLRRCPYNLSPEQMNEIRIVENVILRVVDRDNDLMPPLITLSEITRGMPNQALMLPRLSEKLSTLYTHFRPIADLTYISGRGFIYPIAQHPLFFPLTSCWDDYGANIVHYAQSHHTLPYKPEHLLNPVFTTYMILRQPWGKDSIQFRSLKPKPNWDTLLAVMISESMAVAESLPENEPIPRYQWDNLVNITIYGITNHLINPKNFFATVRKMNEKCNYTRARDEVMWLVFQIVGSHLIRLDDAVTEIIELYNQLFNGDVVWTGASDHPALFARFLAAASVWMTLEKDYADKLPPANETLTSHIKVIQDGVENFDSNNIAMLAVLSNISADRSDSKMGKLIPVTLSQILETVDETSQPLFELSYKRTAVNSFTAFPVEFMEALTFKSKKNLLMHCFQFLRGFSTDRLPSPAIFETIAKICQSEDYEMAVKDVETLAQRSLHVSTTSVRSADNRQELLALQAKDQCHFMFDFLVYRLPHLHAYAKYSTTINVLGHFTQHIPNNPQNHQIYRLMEQFLMRRWCWRGFHECLCNYISLFGVSHKDQPLMRNLANPKSFSSPVDQYQFPFNPEIFKMALYNFMRAIKITGHDLSIEGTMFPTLINAFGWPEKSTAYFPEWALEEIKCNAYSSTSTSNYEEILSAVRGIGRMHPSLTPNQFLLKYGDDPDPKTSYCMIAVIFLFALNDPNAKWEITSEFYEYFRVMEKKTPKDIVVMGNYLIDYIIGDVKSKDSDELTFKNIAKAAALLVFQYQVLRADRFLLSLIMHPSTDEDALICVQIANEFILTSEFQERIRWFHQNVPKKDQFPTEYIKAIVKYHDAFPEFEACELGRGFDATANNVHMPTYYGCLIERLLPIMDQYVHVALEQQGYRLNPHILQTVSMFYKYHAMPLHFMYSVLFTSHGLMSGPDAKSFVLAFAAHIDECYLTEAFEKYNHQKASKEQLIMELIDRLSTSADFILTPPSFVAKDWKTAEFTPAAQTLHLACIELMASPHSPEDLVAAMINVLQVKPHSRPFNVINLIALLLTALPAAYGNSLHEELVAVIVNGDTANLSIEEIVFDNYEESLLLNIPNRSRTINVVSQMFWMQQSSPLPNFFSHVYVARLLDLVKTEKDLWYTLRLVTPFLRRYYENWDTAKQMRSQRENFGPLHIVKLVFEKMGKLAEDGMEFEHQTMLCDLLYNCKYFFAGDILRNTATTVIAKLPERMREFLKFYVSQSDPSADHDVAEEEAEKVHEKEQEPIEQQKTDSASTSSAVPHIQHHHHPQSHPTAAQMMPPPQLPFQHHHQPPQHHPIDQHQAPLSVPPLTPAAAPPAQQHHPMPTLAMHQSMTPQYPGAVFHHPQGPAPHHPMQYGMPHHMQHHPLHQQIPGQMHLNPMMHNMTQQQQYAYMQQMQHHQQYLQQQQQQHHHQQQQQQQQQQQNHMG